MPAARFDEFHASLRDELEARLAAARTPAHMLDVALHWPFEMALQRKSELVRDWLQASGLTCGAHETILHLPADAVDALSWEL